MRATRVGADVVADDGIGKSCVVDSDTAAAVPADYVSSRGRASADGVVRTHANKDAGLVAEPANGPGDVGADVIAFDNVELAAAVLAVDDDARRLVAEVA